MRHTPETIAKTQGWIGNQIQKEADIEGDGQENALKVLAQWRILDEAIDDFQREHATMFEKLRVIAIENITK